MDWFPYRSAAQNTAGSLGNDPSDTPWTKWFGGVVVPVGLMIVAGVALLSEGLRVPWFSRYGFFIADIDGWDLPFFGGLLLGLALVLHGHCFWGQRYASDHAAVYLNTAGGLLLCIAGALGLAYRTIWFS